ncbi:hypothetical protein Y032_0715g1770 [Ancylostoma ceylanicum]|nr:hypothetical protein Y032_0715g1770 [Ancylostoma ceylanicum]
MSSSNVASALRSILTTDNNLSSELSTALISLGLAIDQIQTKQQETLKELELVRRMSRTNWLMVINMPLRFGVSKGQALQQLFTKLDYMKPLFDSDRDLLANDTLLVNKNGQHCNMSFFVAQRHYNHLMSATFQKRIIEYNQNLPKDCEVKNKEPRVEIVSFHRIIESDLSSDRPFQDAEKARAMCAFASMTFHDNRSDDKSLSIILLSFYTKACILF